MTTPIDDFIRRYVESGPSRLHVPGHKGVGPLGFERFDITEIDGAGALYGASDIIAGSQRNASALFGSAATFYSAEGSSLCVRAMLFLAMTRAAPKGRPVALAARNAHKAFVYAAALCDFDVEWLWPEADGPLCACPVSPKALAQKLDAMPEKPFCVYVTSPDYLGGMQDVRALAEVCHARGVPLLVDNAHGAYLKFLPESLHPMDLGADMCCDSAHKTLPVLTGGAYLHVSRDADPGFIDGAADALSLFSSTSPSWLILRSLDLCNARLAGDFPRALAGAAERVAALKRELTGRGFGVLPGEPMKLTISAFQKAPHRSGELSPQATEGDPLSDDLSLADGFALADRLRQNGVECEYADAEHVVLMFSPDNAPEDFDRISRAVGTASEMGWAPHRPCGPPPHCDGEADLAGFPTAPPRPEAAGTTPPSPAPALTLREAVFAPSELVPVELAEGRVCAAPTVSCPPAVPVTVSGERITAEAVRAFQRYGIDVVRVIRQSDLTTSRCTRPRPPRS